VNTANLFATLSQNNTQTNTDAEETQNSTWR